MSDRFASIAAEDTKFREPLVRPKPIADNGIRFPLADAVGYAGDVYKKITEKHGKPSGAPAKVRRLNRFRNIPERGHGNKSTPTALVTH